MWPCALCHVRPAQSVEGTVVDSVTGNRIAAAFVSLMPAAGDPANGYAANVNALGHLRFESVKAGSHHFLYSPPAYLPSDPMAGIRETQISGDGKPVKLEALMAPLPRISGRVVDGDCKGIPNAVLEAIGRRDPPTTTDASGKFELRPQPGS